MARVLDSGRYDLALYSLFLKWRSVYQKDYYGMSNTSEIPNDKYNKKRWGVVRVIEQYVEKNPGDAWAKRQIQLLMDLPIIERGNINLPAGNTNLLHFAALFGE